MISRAEEFEAGEHWSEAMEKYKLAIESMLLVLHTEPSIGDSIHRRRADLLKRQINKWLTRAEQLQHYIGVSALRSSEVSLGGLPTSCRALSIGDNPQ